jgi:hypothetical protein
MNYLSIKPDTPFSMQYSSLVDSVKDFYWKYLRVHNGYVDLDHSISMGGRGDCAELLSIKTREQEWGSEMLFNFRSHNKPSTMIEVPISEISIGFLVMLENEIRKNEAKRSRI